MEKKRTEARFMIVVDTDVFIDFFRNHKPAVDFFSRIKDEDRLDEVFFSAISESEIIAGTHCNNPDYKERTLHFLGEFNKVIIDNKIAVLSGDIKRINDLSIPDAIIAATALVLNATLITRNVKDFDKVKELSMHKPY